MSSDPADDLVVEVTSANAMDLDSISLSSGDYLDAITSEEVVNSSETIMVPNAEESGETREDLLEKENNLIIATEETVESSEMINNLNESSSSTQHIIVSSASNVSNSKVQLVTGTLGDQRRIVTGKIINSRVHNILQRPLSISNVTSFKKPVTSSIGGTVPRNIMSKIVVSQSNAGQPLFITTTDQKTNYVKIVPASQANNPTRTITLAQAQKFGLLTSGKLQQILPSVSGGKNMILNKAVVTSPKKVTMIKSPAKILPAPPQASFKTATGVLVPQQGQRIVLNQMIRIPQSSLPTMSIQQIPGSNKVQFVRVLQAGSGSGGATVTSNKQPQLLPRTINIPAVSNSTPRLTVKKSIPMFVAARPGGTTLTTTTGAAVPRVASNDSIVSSTDSVDSSMNKPEEELISETVTTTLEEVVEQEEEEEEDGAQIKLDDHSTQDKEYESGSEDVASNTMDAKVHGSRTLDPKSIRPRKPCNCTKSMCLKLYCDCFANGEFCYQCNCNSCYNNIEHEDDRHHAIQQCLERNPSAFRPKIGKCLVGEGERRHTKGCNCKRSGCLKNYCECYEAKIPCSNNCKCVSCRNVEDNLFLRLCQSEKVDKSSDPWRKKMEASEDQARMWSSKLAFTFMTDRLITSTCQCLLTRAETSIANGLSAEEMQKVVIEEFGSCLEQIIDAASTQYVEPPGNNNPHLITKEFYGRES